MKNKILSTLVAIVAAFAFSGCGSASNTVTGFDPSAGSGVGGTNPNKIDKTKDSELTSMAYANRRTASSYKVSASLGDKISGAVKTSSSGNYKVSASVRGELNTIQ